MVSTETEQIVNRLRELGDSEIAAHSQRFFKTGRGEYGEGDKFLGIRVPVIRKYVREYRAISLPDASQVSLYPPESVACKKYPGQRL